MSGWALGAGERECELLNIIISSESSTAPFGLLPTQWWSLLLWSTLKTLTIFGWHNK